MSRGFWFLAGAASGVYALAKARRAVSVFTPDGVSARIAALRAGGRVFSDAVREGMAERETDLRVQLDAGPDPSRLLVAAQPSASEAQSPSASDFELEGNVHGHG
jgi:uncharacterized protein DUF6167